MIKILFTPDEEIGRGVDRADLKKLGADFAYTIDGETAGNIEDETFSADRVTLTIEGVSTHPGFAKGKMEHAIKIAAAIVDRLPKNTCSPRPPRRPARLSASHRHFGGAGEGHARFHRARFHRGGIAEKEALLETIVQEVMRTSRARAIGWKSSSNTAT